jgi:hypothetical protein
VTQGDPTDQALATIASILDHSEQQRGHDKHVSTEKPVAEEDDDEARVLQGEPATKAAAEVDGYSKIGPGPLATIRFKWTVRRGEDGQYFVQETVGNDSAPVIIGPLSADAAVEFVDERESEARQRFERLKNEMAVRMDTAELIRLGGGEL